jgi:hypothetical protein
MSLSSWREPSLQNPLDECPFQQMEYRRSAMRALQPLPRRRHRARRGQQPGERAVGGREQAQAGQTDAAQTGRLRLVALMIGEVRCAEARGADGGANSISAARSTC